MWIYLTLCVFIGTVLQKTPLFLEIVLKTMSAGCQSLLSIKESTWRQTYIGGWAERYHNWGGLRAAVRQDCSNLSLPEEVEDQCSLKLSSVGRINNACRNDKSRGHCLVYFTRRNLNESTYMLREHSRFRSFTQVWERCSYFSALN